MKFSAIMTKRISDIMTRGGVRFAYLFGSQASGESRNGSDIDIAVMLPTIPKSKRFKRRLELIRKLSILLNHEVDVVVLNDAPSILFNFLVVARGKRLFGRKTGEMAEFECKVLREYADFRPFLDLYNKHYVERDH